MGGLALELSSKSQKSNPWLSTWRGHCDYRISIIIQHP